MARAPSANAAPPAALTPPRRWGITKLILAAAGAALLVGVAQLAWSWRSGVAKVNRDLFPVAQRQHAAGQWQVAGELASRAEVDPEDSQQLALQQFLTAAGKVSEARESPDVAAAQVAYHQAVSLLRSASQAWPEGHQDDGQRLLAEALFHTGQYAEAARLIEIALRHAPQHDQDRLMSMLVRSLMHGGGANLDRARQAIERWNQLPSRSHKTQISAALLQIECLSRSGDYAAARQLVEQIRHDLPPQSAGMDEQQRDQLQRWRDELDLLQAASVVAEASGRLSPDHADKPLPAELQAALRELRRLQRDATPRVALQTGLWLARGLMLGGAVDEALAQLNTVRLHQPFAGDAVAAALAQIEYLAQRGSGAEALQVARHLIQEVGSRERYDPSVVDLEEFRLRIHAVLDRLRQAGQFDTAIALTRALPPLLPAADAYYEEGLAYREAAEQLLAANTAPTAAQDPAVQARIRQLQSGAGQAFHAAAMQQFERTEYPETLWQAIVALQDSGQFARTIPLLHDYLVHQNRIRHPQALIALGKAYLADNQPEAAVNSLRQCIGEFPRDPLRYDARLQAAKAYAELDQIDAAKELLEVNLTDGELTPQSPVWEDSLYTLADILWRRCHDRYLQDTLSARQRREPLPLAALRANQPQVEEAIQRLRETVERYWPAPRTVQTALNLARANRLAAALLQAEAATPDVLDATRRQLLQRREHLLQDAVATYRRTRQELQRWEDTETDDTVARSQQQAALLGEADTLFELSRYEESADAYRSISLQYMNEPLSLEAMLGQVRALRQLKKDREARLVIRQAVAVLNRIPPEWDDRIASTTRYDRNGWQQLLGWLDRNEIPEMDS